jgi:hypothetical protein
LKKWLVPYIVMVGVGGSISAAIGSTPNQFGAAVLVGMLTAIAAYATTFRLLGLKLEKGTKNHG